MGGRADVPLLEAYVRNVVLARTLRAAIKDPDSLPLGRAAISDQRLKLAADAESAAHRYASSLLLTPESRKRHKIREPAAGRDELTALIA